MGLNLNCTDLTPTQSKALADIPMILKLALTNQDYLNAILTKLNEIEKAQGSQTTLNYAPKGIANSGTINGNATVINGPPPLKMSDEDFKKFAAVYEKNAATRKDVVGTIVLVETYDAGAFELSEQLCAPAKYFHWFFACPYQPGLSVTSSRYMSLEVDCAEVADSAVSLVGRSLAINGGDVTQIKGLNCMTRYSVGEGAEPHESDYQPIVKGLQCYYDGWDRPEGIEFKDAMKAGGLNCQYIDHSYHISSQELLTGLDGHSLESITVVIGDPVTE
jgi:hypothetical protein